MVDVVNRQPEKANNKAKTTTIKHTIVVIVIRIGQPEVATERCQQINTKTMAITNTTVDVVNRIGHQ